MKKIISIILLLTCILCITSCGGDKITPKKAASFEQICAVLRENAEIYRICDEGELKSHVDFFSSENHDYSEEMLAMCYAKMPDGKYIKCIEMVDSTDAEFFVKSYGKSFTYAFNKGNVAIFGNAPFIEEFKAD